jgi:hypothetical protein
MVATFLFIRSSLFDYCLEWLTVVCLRQFLSTFYNVFVYSSYGVLNRSRRCGLGVGGFDEHCHVLYPLCKGFGKEVGLEFFLVIL